MHVIQQSINQFLDAYPTTGKYLVAFSGGCDSMVLLHAVHNYIDADRLTAIHINHGLQQQSDGWDCFCRRQAEKLDIPYLSLKADLKNISSNIEERAREERYRILADQMSEGDVLLTAHHRDDQAETLLLQLMRGAGVDGLSAMPVVTAYARGKLLRPLLHFSRTELEAYANSFALQWIDDPSNMDNRFDRNYLRNEIIPLLEKRWPGVRNNISRSAFNCSEAAELVHIQASEDLATCQEKYAHILSIERLCEFSSARKHHIVRAWILENRAVMPDRDKIEKICSEVIEAREDAQPVISWADAEVHRFRQSLYLLKSLKPGLPGEIKISKQDVDRGYVELPAPAGHLYFNFDTNLPDNLFDHLTVRFRSNGQKVELYQRQGSRKLKKLFQEWGIPPWMRDYVPLLYIKEQCLAIADIASCEHPQNSLLKSISWKPLPGYEW